MLIKRIIYATLILQLFIFSSCEKPKLNIENETLVQAMTTDTNETDVVVNTSEDSYIILFSDPVIETITRRILNKEKGDITKDEVLSITEFPDSHHYDNDKTISYLSDLKWFKNLKELYLIEENIDDLTGIEELINLEELNINGNHITSIEQVSKLTNLVDFDCANNNIKDLSPISNLINLEILSINDNHINLSSLKNLTKLRKLYASSCDISDISILANLKDIEYLSLCSNNINDIKVLKDLQKLMYLDLYRNNVSDITPLEKFTSIEDFNLDENPIPEDILNEFYEKDNFIQTFHEKFNSDGPEFNFYLKGYYNRKKTMCYYLESLTITDASSGDVIQDISIPELSLFGITNVPTEYKESKGFQFEDVNFDGYKDIRLFDTFGRWELFWIYLVWNPDKQIFVQDKNLTGISMAEFDQEKQLIYERRNLTGGNEYLTHKYVNGVITKISSNMKRMVRTSNEWIKQNLQEASIDLDIGDGIWFHEMDSERNEETEEMVVVRNEFIFYLEKEVIARFDASSEIGEIIQNSEAAM